VRPYTPVMELSRGEVESPSAEDPRIVLRGLRWKDYEALLRIRGERAVPRMTYLEGELELMSPSSRHETVKKMIARLLEAHAVERGLVFNGYGSWTLKDRRLERGLEADECYVLTTGKPKVPDLAIEVVRSSPLVDKLEVYRGLGVREVWVWRDGAITIHRLRRGRYAVIPRSELLPELDLELLLGFVDREDQTAAVREYQARLRG
jgi:Uma2 family endonuclease